MTFARDDVQFVSHGQRCAAWLYRPDVPGPHPAVVMAHGFAGVRGARLPAYAERFADAGFAVLVFDYRHFGDSEGEPRQLLSIRRQLQDWRAAIQFVRGLGDVEATRVAAWGTSFSGGHVITLAAEDSGLAAGVAQVPMSDGLAAVRATGRANIARLMRPAMADAARALIGAAPVTVPVVGPPGSTAAMNTPDAEPGYRALLEPDLPWDNRVAARFGLTLGAYRPVRHAERIAIPVLLCVAEHDSVAPPEPSLAVASRAPHAELVRYPIGHFDIYRGEPFERALADQLAFLQRALLPREARRDAEQGKDAAPRTS